MLGWFAETTLVAAGLAALALVLGAARWFRLAPEARHALWLVVLVKFLLPPVVAWPWAASDRPTAPSPPTLAAQPSFPTVPEPFAAAPPAPVEPEVPAGPLDIVLTDPPEPPAGLVGDDPPPPPVVALDPPRLAAPIPAESAPVEPASPLPVARPGLHWRSLLLGGWLVGTTVVAAWGGARIDRVRRQIRHATPAEPWLRDEVAAVSTRLGIVAPPRVLVVAGLPTPLLWCLGRPRLVVPHLLDELEPAARAGLLAHELAHLVRRDHWVVWLELAAGLIWWWNPVFRFARRRLRDEAEAACDARVVRAFPTHRFAYAEALVQVCERHAGTVPPLPALGIGGPGAARTLEARLLMILRDPIRPPSRWLPLLALVLLALAVPAWTLGQQDPARPADPLPNPLPIEPSSPPAQPVEAAPADPLKPAADPKAQPVAPVAPAPAWTIDQIHDGIQQRPWPAAALAFRYVAASRYLGPIGKTQVRVQAADVVLGTRSGPDERTISSVPERNLGRLSRLDVLTVGPRRVGNGWQAAGPDPTGWGRRFVAQTPTDAVTFEATSGTNGPVPLHWSPAPIQNAYPGDDLARFLGGPQQFPGPDRDLDPLDPRVANLLDLSGATRWLFGSSFTRTQLAGVELIDGLEAVRVAWISVTSGGPGAPGVRGLCWVAPARGFAVVRLEATTNPFPLKVQNRSNTATLGRVTWRKVASDFHEVGGGLWLPGKVTWQSVAEPGTIDQVRSHELVATFEDYQVNPQLGADTFKPHFNIAALDAPNGDFTATPPAVPAGLADRLGQAVAASPFGPPREEKPSDAALEAMAADLNEPTARMVLAEMSRPPVVRPPGTNDASTPAGGPVAQAGLAVEPAAARKVEVSSGPIEGDPGFAAAQARVKAFATRLERIRRDTRNSGDPAETRAAEQLARAQAELDDLRPQRAADPGPAIGQAALIQPRRDAQAAEVRRYEGQRRLAAAAVERQKTLNQRIPNSVSNEEMQLSETKLIIAQAEVEREQARLAEIDVLLDHAKPAPLRRSDRDSGGIPVLQARRDAQAAEVMGVEAERERAQAELKRTAALHDRNAITDDHYERVQANTKVAEAAVAREQAKLVEAEALLDQATTGATGNRNVASPESPVALREYRDLADLAAFQIQVKQAEVRQAETKLSQAKAKAVQRGPLSQVEADVPIRLAQDEVGIKRAELGEANLRAQQARRRAEAELVRVKRLAERARDRLDWSRSMAQKGYVSKATLHEDRDRYDDLMLQIDSNYKPASESSGESAQPGQPDYSTR